MYVIIDRDIPTAIDPYAGIAAEMDVNKDTVNLAVLVDTIEKLEDIADDLMGSLDPMTLPLISYPRREGVYLNLGRVTNFVCGFMAGLAIAVLIALGVLP